MSSTSFVSAAYTGILGRDADPGALAKNVQALGSGSLSRSDLLQELVRSAEFRASFSDRLTDEQRAEVERTHHMAMSFVQTAYQGILGREPDPPAIHRFVPALGGGRLSRANILHELVSLAESQNRFADKSGMPIIGEILQELEAMLADKFGFHDVDGKSMNSIGYNTASEFKELTVFAAIRDLILVLKDQTSLIEVSTTAPSHKLVRDDPKAQIEPT